MKIAGFVSEFNPLHKGHEYFINKIKEDNADLIITAMSPHFVMRGEPAIFNKFERCKLALDKGVDLVLEIPTTLTIESSDIYAYSAIKILNNAKITDLYFGSEIDDISIFNKVIDITKTIQFKEQLNFYLKEGNSFNQSYKKSIISIDSSLEEYLYYPNFMLGLEYIKAINEINPNINIHIIKRVETLYYDDIKEGTQIQSASSIRKEINNGNVAQYLSYSFEKFIKHVKNDYFNLIKYKIESSSKDELKDINGISEGIENSLKSTKYSSYDELVSNLISKRNRETKINRILFSILLNIKKNEISKDIDYIRVLGLNSKSRKYIKSLDVNVYTTINKNTDQRILRELDFTKIYDIYNENLVLKEYKPIINP